MEDINTIRYDDLSDTAAMNMVGAKDHNLHVLSECFDKEISFRDNAFNVKNCDSTTLLAIKKVLDAMHSYALSDKRISEQDVIYACRQAARNEDIAASGLANKIVGRTLSGKAVTPKTNGQLTFVTKMETDTIVFAIGPAGTGKTYLAVIAAVAALKKGDVKRIVLTRPAVEAGESLGFLPGDMKEKVDPYLTPLYDALHDMLGNEQTDKLIEKGTIEIAPLAYMRGRTLDDSFVILDEAQNTTPAQMKMFLTRLGFHSKMVITGDITQIDLNKGMHSGLIEASGLLSGIEQISILHLTSDDVVRHPLVQKIIERYAVSEKK